MVYRGRVEHGVVILDEPQAIPDGAQVEVLVVSPRANGVVGEALQKLAGKAKELPADLAVRHDHYRREQST